MDISSYKEQLDIHDEQKKQRSHIISFLGDTDSDWDTCDFSTLPEHEISLIETFNWNSPRPKTPLSPQEMALCFVLSVADGNVLGDVDVIADTFMQRATITYHTQEIIRLLKLWTDITQGNIQMGQTRTALVRNRFKNPNNEGGKKLYALKYMHMVKQTIFSKSVLFDPIPEHTLRLEFSPQRFYYGRSNKTPGRESDKTIYIKVEDETFLEDVMKMMVIVGDDGELDIKSFEFDQYFLLMDSATGTKGKKGKEGGKFLIGDNLDSDDRTEQLDSYKTDLELHEEGGFLENFYQYPITSRKEWRRIKKEKKIPVPAAISNFWEVVKDSALGNI